ncbi:MAG: hypothetical protein ACR2IE_09720 [Candidatus Sumerlaeaceae bacterium]
MALTCQVSWCVTPDSNYLYGIHWYGNLGASDVEAMSGGKGIWVLDQALLNGTATRARGNEWETPWVTAPTIDTTTAYAKPGWMSQITGKGHSLVLRLQPQWGVTMPYPGNSGLGFPADPYTSTTYASDCKSAANLMKNCHVWVLANEANLTDENFRWNSASSDYNLAWPAQDLAQLPELYAAQYVACRDKIHEVAPETNPANQIVLMQPTSPGGIIGGLRFMDSNEFLIRMISAVPDKTKIDGFALHSYADPSTGNYGADGFMETLRQQLTIIDQYGLGDRPIFITEFNRDMPNASDVPLGAQFLTTAYSMLNSWNTGSSQVWPGQPSHKFTGTNWFIYPTDATWNRQSLLYSKTAGGTPTTQPWYAFQNICLSNFAKGGTNGPSITSSNKWWEDDFAGSGSPDQAQPLPHWKIENEGTAGSVALSGAGNLRLIGGPNGNGIAGIRTADTYKFADFKLQMDFTFTNASPIATGANVEANLDLRIRERTDTDGRGYSLTFYSSAGTNVNASKVVLRRTVDWDTVYKSQTVGGGINSAYRFRVVAAANGTTLQYTVLRLPDLSVVLDWTGANQVVNSDQRFGAIRVMTYNLQEAQIENIQMGGPSANLNPAAVAEWRELH